MAVDRAILDVGCRAGAAVGLGGWAAGISHVVQRAVKRQLRAALLSPDPAA